MRFAAFGMLGLGIDLALLALLLAVTTLPRVAAITVAFLATYAINFALNRRFSFEADGSLAGQLRRFAGQVAVDYLLTLGAVQSFTALGVPVLAARVLAGGTNATFNYLTYRFWTFRTQRS